MKKKNIIYTAFIIAMICNMAKVWSQSTSSATPNLVGVPNTPSTAVDYNGWTFGTLGSAVLTTPELTIKNEDPMPISFYTNAGAGSLNFMRMWIYDGNGQLNDGFACTRRVSHFGDSAACNLN